MHPARFAGVALILLGVLPQPLLSQNDDEGSRATLAGLAGVQVVVESLPLAATRYGLDRATLRTDIELRLRMAGLRVVESDSASSSFLYVAVNLQDSDVGIAAYSLSVAFYQFVRLYRLPQSALPVMAITWSVHGVGTARIQSVPGIRDYARDYVDRFINAYLAVNPRR